MEKEKRIKFVLAGIILFITLGGMFFAAIYGNNSLLPIIFINGGLIILVIAIFRFFKRGDLPDKDERTKKLSAYGITYSWLLTLVVITGLSLIQNLGLIQLSVELVLGVLLFFMIISANVFRWYFMQKGDIE